ncbi:AraC family transcriptional regulator [Sphingomonas hengshuiensis]|uniref:AraC family transcriptional regulator n=1 Tax=Sphingomonas hengshuiensis TaxID=1609977 RepID=UPI001D11D5B6|nr:helix-turn-helix domain-containing protein [Sphingomonas hengshuiensis]
MIPTIEFRKATGSMMPLVESYYLYRYEAALVEGIERVDLGQLRFVLRGEGEMTFPDGRVERTRPVMINGPGTAAATYRVDGPFHCFGVSLRAIGWKTLIGIPAHKVTDHIIDGEKLFCEQAALLLGRLRKMATLEEMVAAVEPLLKMRRHEVKPVPHAHLPFLRAVREWTVIEDGTLDQLYDSIRATSGLGERQVQRLCREYFGSAPMHLKRKFRAIRAAMRLYQGAPLSDVIGPFADQSHMINEIKHFTGHTPRTLRERIDPVLAATLDNETFHFLPDVIPEELVDRRPK